ncbi:porin family protein [Ulvibacter antarcticus]|uniref:Outer membrane protein with beta-barrel domain n=1 Tax=Ulvibacter antarcticus TaxID=442714 RepID=A0A3L9YUH6_9FLAO|nr:porin family protein [Ulvibacter antarcticus]RMA64163.1 outer membrane protein with beta-barrel domain [Ulvibacter antarcticus]
MKKLFLFIALGLFLVTSSFAQGEIRLGVKAGLNLASIGGDAYYTGFGGFNSRTSFHIGGLVEVPVTDKISVQPEILYSSQGSKTNYGFGTTENSKLDYLNIPVMGKYHIIQGLSAELGPVIGILVNAESVDFETGLVGETKDQYKGLDIGIGIGASYRLPMGFFGSLRYNKGVTDINDIKDEDFNAKNQNNVFQVSAGYSF